MEGQLDAINAIPVLITYILVYGAIWFRNEVSTKIFMIKNCINVGNAFVFALKPSPVLY